LVDRLAGSGLLLRERTPGRREVDLHLTDAGEALLRQGLRARSTALNALVASLTPKEQAQLVKLIAKSLAQGRRHREEADVACRLCDWDACKPVCPVDASVVDESPA
jgi:MarR family transcriptional regulator, negative regulator of the multidrug operon emrRAB